MSGEVVVREWNYTETHLPVRRVDEHNACVTALREALADAARLREALRKIAAEKPETDYISRVGVMVVTGMSRTEIVQFARAALGQEEP